jgi:hypothetical protein
MTRFLLYDTFKDVSVRKLTREEKRTVIDRFSTTTDEQKEMIIMLIYQCWKDDNPDDVIDSIPYSGIYKNADINNCQNLLFDLNRFPTKLQCIIYKFTERFGQQ